MPALYYAVETNVQHTHSFNSVKHTVKDSIVCTKGAIGSDKGAIGAGGEAVGEKTEGGCGESVQVLLPPVAKLSVLRTARFRLRRRCDSKAGGVVVNR